MFRRLLDLTMLKRHTLLVARIFPLLGALAFYASSLRADVGLSVIAGKDGNGLVTVFYPSGSEARLIHRGPFSLRAVVDGEPKPGNGRLIVISHGSGASPWVYSDLASTLVAEGFVVALPEHAGDNYKDSSEPGPTSWKRRPLEVSSAIDTIAQDPRFANTLQLQRVGMYGMSAGGHTALALAGGRWSAAGVRKHCEQHIAEDFNACVGDTTHLTGSVLDGIRKSVALAIIRGRYEDESWVSYTDPRIAAIVSGVPYAADFDFDSLKAPRVPLAMITAQQDVWLNPRFHSTPVLQACASCEKLLDLPNGGHSALLSPVPPNLSGTIAYLLADPPGFDPALRGVVNQKIAAWFRQKLLP